MPIVSRIVIVSKDHKCNVKCDFYCIFYGNIYPNIVWDYITDNYCHNGKITYVSTCCVSFRMHVSIFQPNV